MTQFINSQETINVPLLYIDLQPGQHAIPKTAEVAYSVSQLWEEIA